MRYNHSDSGCELENSNLRMHDGEEPVSGRQGPGLAAAFMLKRPRRRGNSNASTASTIPNTTKSGRNMLASLKHTRQGSSENANVISRRGAKGSLPPVEPSKYSTPSLPHPLAPTLPGNDTLLRRGESSRSASPSTVSPVSSYFSPSFLRQDTQPTLAALSSSERAFMDEVMLSPPAPAFLGHHSRHRNASKGSGKPLSAFGSGDVDSRVSMETSLTENSFRHGASTANLTVLQGKHDNGAAGKKGTLLSIRDAFKTLGRRFTRRAGGANKTEASSAGHKPLFLVGNPPVPTVGLGNSPFGASAPCLTLSLAAADIDTSSFGHDPLSSFRLSNKITAPTSKLCSTTGSLASSFTSLAQTDSTSSKCTTPPLSPLVHPILSPSLKLTSDECAQVIRGSLEVQLPTAVVNATGKVAMQRLTAQKNSMQSPKEHLSTTTAIDTTTLQDEGSESFDDYGSDADLPSKGEAHVLTVQSPLPASVSTKMDCEPKTAGCKSLYACTMLKMHPLLWTDTTPLQPFEPASPRSMNKATGFDGHPRRSLVTHNLRIWSGYNSIARRLTSDSKSTRSKEVDKELTWFVEKYLPKYVAPQDVMVKVKQSVRAQSQTETRAVAQLQNRFGTEMHRWMTRTPFLERKRCLREDGSERIINPNPKVKPQPLSFSKRCCITTERIRVGLDRKTSPSISNAGTTSRVCHKQLEKPLTLQPPSTPNKSGPGMLFADHCYKPKSSSSSWCISAFSDQSGALSSPNTLYEWSTEHEFQENEDDVPLAILSQRRARRVSTRFDDKSACSIPSSTTSVRTLSIPMRTPIQNVILSAQIERQREARMREMEINKKLLSEARARRAFKHGPAAYEASQIAAEVSTATQPKARVSFVDSPANGSSRDMHGYDRFAARHGPSSYKSTVNNGRLNQRIGKNSLPPNVHGLQRRLSTPASTTPDSMSPSIERFRRAPSEVAETSSTVQDSATYNSPHDMPNVSQNCRSSYLAPLPMSHMLPVGYAWAPVPIGNSYFPQVYTGMPQMPVLVPPYMPTVQAPSQQQLQSPVMQPTSTQRPALQRHNHSTSAVVPSSRGTRSSTQQPGLPYSVHSSPTTPSLSPTPHHHRTSTIGINGMSSASSSTSQPARRSPLAQHVYSRR